MSSQDLPPRYWPKKNSPTRTWISSSPLASPLTRGLFWGRLRRGKSGCAMIFEQIATGGCQSYLIGCADSHSAILIDPHLAQIDRYLGLAAKDGVRVRYVLDTHTHADHFSAAKELSRHLDVPAVAS